METEEKDNEINKIQSLKKALDEKKITVDEIPEQYLDIISKLYTHSINEKKAQIEEADKSIKDYKKKMEEAIKDLKDYE